MKSCVIFSGGEKVDKSCADFDEINNSLVISADKGFELACEWKIKPDIVMGDFDSLGKIPENEGKVLVFPSEKDDTDLMLAVKEGLKRGCEKFVLYGCLGGRLDHTLGNLQTLAYLVEKGATGKIVSENEIIQLVPKGKYIVNNQRGFSLSLLSFSEKVSGLTIKGTKYRLENGTISNSLPIGISNAITDESAEISFESGELLVIQSRIL